MPQGSSGAAAGLRGFFFFFFFLNVRIPANVAQIKFKLEVNREEEEGSEGGDCFHLEIPPLHFAEIHIPNLGQHSLLSPTYPTFAADQK